MCHRLMLLISFKALLHNTLYNKLNVIEHRNINDEVHVFRDVCVHVNVFVCV